MWQGRPSFVCPGVTVTSSSSGFQGVSERLLGGLTANAYRVLGLPASASQAEIQEAAGVAQRYRFSHRLIADFDASVEQPIRGLPQPTEEN